VHEEHDDTKTTVIVEQRPLTEVNALGMVHRAPTR
jgi:hypothetical protein